MVTVLPFTARLGTYYCRFSSHSSSTSRYHAATQAFNFIEKWMFNFLPCDYFRHISILIPGLSLVFSFPILLMRFILSTNDLSHLCLIKIGFNAGLAPYCRHFFSLCRLKFIANDNGIPHIVDIVNTAFTVYGLLYPVQCFRWKIASNTVILAQFNCFQLFVAIFFHLNITWIVTFGVTFLMQQTSSLPFVRGIARKQKNMTAKNTI